MTKTIYALGVFDGVHLGHQALLKASRALARENGWESAAITFSSHPDALVLGSSPRLLNTIEDRVRLLGQQVDRVVTLPFDKAMQTMPWEDFLHLLREEYGAAGLVCGHDFRFGHRGAGNARLLGDFCQIHGLPWAVVPEQTLDGVPISSTHIRSLLEAGKLEEANGFLGHPHCLSGQVVSGRKLGRTLGIPTANLQIPEEVIRLPRGVYACKAVAGEREYPAVTNIGSRPTVNGHQVRAESWLLDFAGDLYGQELTLLFYRFLRPEQKFDTLEALKEEILKNAAETRKFFENNTK